MVYTIRTVTAARWRLTEDLSDLHRFHMALGPVRVQLRARRAGVGIVCCLQILNG